MNQDRARITVADGAVAAILFAVAAAVGAYHGFDRPLHHEHDANITYLYQTLLINDGLKQTYMDHTGYLFLTLLSAWLKIVHLFGGVPAIGVSALEGNPDMRAQFFDLLVAARVLPVILTGAMGGVFYALLRVLDIRWTLAAAVAGALLLSPGIVEQTIRLHTELPAMLCVLAALLALALAHRAAGPRGFIGLGAAAFFAVAAMLSKIQVFPFMLVLPLAPLAFLAVLGARPSARPPSAAAVAFAAPWAVAFSVPALFMAVGVVAFRAGPPLLISPALYVPLFVIYTALAGGVYAWLTRRGVVDILAAGAAVLAGASTGAYLVLIHHNPEVFAVTVRFVDQLAHHATPTSAGASLAAGDHGVAALANKVFELIAPTLERAFHVGPVAERSGNAIGAAYWAVALGTLACAAFDRRLAVVAAGLLALALGMEVFCRLRYLAPWYLVLIEPWVWLAAALLAARGVVVAGSPGLPAKAMAGVTVAGLALSLAFGAMDAGRERPARDPKTISVCDRPNPMAPRLHNIGCFRSP